MKLSVFTSNAIFLHTEYSNTFVSVEINYDTNITITCKFHAQSSISSTSTCSIEYKDQVAEGTSNSDTVTLNIRPIQGGHQNFTITATNGNHTVQMEGKFNISGTACMQLYYAYSIVNLASVCCL